MDQSLLEKYKKPNEKKRRPPHPLAACADEIERAGLFTVQYGRGYWLRKLSQYGKARKIEPAALYTQLLGILKQIGEMNPKYSKGGTLTNKLKT